MCLNLYLKEQKNLKKFDNYTPLKKDINHVLEEIKNNEELNWPEKMKADPDRRNKAKYCEFHKDHGHMTKNCIALQNEIETLIRRGKLTKYVDRRNDKKTTTK